jgi:hypothetical protein
MTGPGFGRGLVASEVKRLTPRTDFGTAKRAGSIESAVRPQQYDGPRLWPGPCRVWNGKKSRSRDGKISGYKVNMLISFVLE